MLYKTTGGIIYTSQICKPDSGEIKSEFNKIV